MGTALTSLTIFGWIPFVLGLFLLMPPRRAVLWAFFIAWLFLPMAKYSLPGLPDFTKMTASCYGVIIGVILFDIGRLLSFRPNWCDLPLVGLTVVAPLITSFTNRLGAYDGLSNVQVYVASWLLPYLCGRLYFQTLGDMRTLAKAMVIGGIAYLPIILIEWRLSPQLHRWIYGFHQHHFSHASRGGGFRPRGFMQSGLMVSLWMGASTVVLYTLWLSRNQLKILQYKLPMFAGFCVLLISTVMCRSVGALVLTITMCVVLTLTMLLRTRLLIMVLLVVPILYTSTRIGGVWDGRSLVSFVAEEVDPARAQSLEFRINNEDLLVARALQQRWFGWGGWGRSAVTDDFGTRTTVADGMWIVQFGRGGLVSMALWMITLAIPMVLLLWRFPPGMYLSRTLAPVTALASIPVIWNIDCLPNAMENTVFFVIIGGLTTYLMSSEVRNWRKMPRRRPAARAVSEPDPERAAGPQTPGGGGTPDGGPPVGLPGLSPAPSFQRS